NQTACQSVMALKFIDGLELGEPGGSTGHPGCSIPGSSNPEIGVVRIDKSISKQPTLGQKNWPQRTQRTQREAGSCGSSLCVLWLLSQSFVVRFRFPVGGSILHRPS